MAAFEVGDVILGKYEVTAVLGKGGMGVVLAARHRELGELVALKFLLPARDPAQASARFTREARTGMRIKNEHVPRVYDVSRVDDTPFMVMEHLTGQDLSKMIGERGRLPIAEAVDLLLQACEAIADAHNLGIVHRDLKPANLFVTRAPDGTPLVKVLDFGISKSVAPEDAALTTTTAVMGSPLYMSPEQLTCSRDADARSDVWSLGVILYEMLAGTTPFAGDSMFALLGAIHAGAYAKLSTQRGDVPVALDELVADTLARRREARVPSVEAFAARLAPLGSDAARASHQRIQRISVRPPPPPPEAFVPTLVDGRPSAVEEVHSPSPAQITGQDLAESLDAAPRGHSRWQRTLAITVTGAAALLASALLRARGAPSSAGAPVPVVTPALVAAPVLVPPPSPPAESIEPAAHPSPPSVTPPRVASAPARRVDRPDAGAAAAIPTTRSAEILFATQK